MYGFSVPLLDDTLELSQYSLTIFNYTLRTRDRGSTATILGEQ